MRQVLHPGQRGLGVGPGESSAETIERELRRQVEVGRRGGKFMVSVKGPVTPGTSVAKLRLFVELARKVTSVNSSYIWKYAIFRKIY